MQTKLPNITKKLLKFTLALAFWLGLWLIVSRVVGIELLVPSPWSVIRTLKEMLTQKEFYETCLRSFLRITGGYVLGVAAGTVLGMLISFSSVLNSIFKPFLTAVKTTPVVSFIILALIWIERDGVPVFITFLMVMPIVSAGIMTGTQSADKELLEMTKVYKFSFWKKLKYIYLPSAVPSFASACETAIGLGWKAGVAAEVICMSRGTIGKALKDSQVYMETAELFAWTAVIIVISLILEKLLAKLFDIIFKKAVQKGGYFIEHRNY